MSNIGFWVGLICALAMCSWVAWKVINDSEVQEMFNFGDNISKYQKTRGCTGHCLRNVGIYSKGYIDNGKCTCCYTYRNCPAGV